MMMALMEYRWPSAGAGCEEALDPSWKGGILSNAIEVFAPKQIGSEPDVMWCQAFEYLLIFSSSFETRQK
jgi:hypothetical protein